MKKALKSTWTLVIIGLLLIAIDLAVHAASLGVEPAREADLGSIAAKITGIFKSAKEKRIEAMQENERVKKDLHYMAEELDREALGPEDNKPLAEYSAAGLARIANMRLTGNIDPKALVILDRLAKIYRELPTKEYAKDWAGDLVRAVNDELRFDADNSATADEMIDALKMNLDLPAALPGDGDVEDMAFLPVDVPLEKWKKLGPIRVFLSKHRLKRPKSYIQTNVADLIGGKHHVGVGVELEGKVDSASLFFWDQDFCFNIGNLHLEITPEWRLLHPGFRLPKAGDHIRLKGWSYFDYFHGNEIEFDPEDPVVGVNRVTVWEVHPVQDIEYLP